MPPKPKRKAGRSDDIASELARERDRPEPDEATWRQRYTPEMAEQYAAELRDLEDQLDLGWPGWREGKPFHREQHDKIAWIKVRMLRRRLILDGKGDHGVATVRRDEARPVAVPVRPARVEVPRDAYRPLVTVPLLAQRLKLSVSQIQELLPRLPEGVRDVRSWLVGEVARQGSAAPLPVPPGPLSDNSPGVH